MTTRRFEFEEGASGKFWEISVNADEYTLNFGRKGTPGQTRTKSFTTPGLCGPAAEALVQDKLEKGYREVAFGDGAPIVGQPPPRTLRYTMTHPEAKPWVILVTGQRIVTNNIVQILPSVAAAAEHVARLLNLRKKEGYVLQATEEVVADVAATASRSPD